ncbi:MAG: hypothetical protein HDS11_02450 [Bacteroides sp.]|nr:hypothetical protein [Bacteroides sp.]
METGTNARIATVDDEISGDAEHDQTWAAQWKGKMAPSLKEYTYIQGGRVHVEQSKFPTETGYDYKYTEMNYLPEDQLQAYENAYVQYMKTKYNAIIE